MVGTRFRSYLTSICVSEAEALMYVKGGPSACFLLVFHAHRAARAVELCQKQARKVTSIAVTI